MTDHYILRKGEYQPINIIPDGRFKCCMCNRLVPMNEVEDHLSTHVKPKFLAPKTVDHNPAKLAIPASLLQDINTQDSDVNIKSISPQQLPLTEKQRKSALLYEGKQQQYNIQNDIFDPTIKIKKDKADLSSQLGIRLQKQEQPELLQLQTAFQILSSNKKVAKKKISLYRSQNGVEQLQDLNSSKKKQHIGYNRQIIEYQLKDDNASIGSTVVEKQVKTVDVNFSTLPRNSVLFNTSSLYRPIEEKIGGPKTPVKPFNIQDDTSHKKIPKIGCDNKCPCCQGFYCSVCKSNIPPKYRPVEEVSPQQQQQIRDFYRRYYHPPCKNCEPKK